MSQIIRGGSQRLSPKLARVRGTASGCPVGRRAEMRSKTSRMSAVRYVGAAEVSDWSTRLAILNSCCPGRAGRVCKIRSNVRHQMSKSVQLLRSQLRESSFPPVSSLPRVPLLDLAGVYSQLLPTFVKILDSRHFWPGRPPLK